MALAPDPAPVAHAPVADAVVAPAPGSDFYYASLYLEPDRRHEVQVIEACRRAIGGIPQSCSDRGVAHLKLAWWRDELARLDAHAARHPLVRALAPLVARTPVLLTSFARLVDRIDDGMQDEALPTRAAVLAAIADVHGDILRYYLAAGGGGPSDAADDVIALACHLELAYELRGLRQHRRGGPLYLSGERLAVHGLSRDAVRHATRSADLGHFMQEELGWLLLELRQRLAALPRSVRRHQRLLCTLAAIAAAALQLTVADGCQVLEQRIELLPVHKLWLAWRTARWG